MKNDDLFKQKRKKTDTIEPLQIVIGSSFFWNFLFQPFLTLNNNNTVASNLTTIVVVARYNIRFLQFVLLSFRQMLNEWQIKGSISIMLSSLASIILFQSELNHKIVLSNRKEPHEKKNYRHGFFCGCDCFCRKWSEFDSFR